MTIDEPGKALLFDEARKTLIDLGVAPDELEGADITFFRASLIGHAYVGYSKDGRWALWRRAGNDGPWEGAAPVDP